MKRIFSLILSAALMLSLAACENGEETVQTTKEQVQSENTTANLPNENTENPAAEISENGDTKILIAYFTAAENSGVDAVSSASYSVVNGEAVGRLRAIANMIQAKTGGELFSIQTSVVYPTDGGDLIDYAAEEQADRKSVV